MADLIDVANYIIGNEDDPREPGRITTDLGGRTRYGLAEKYNPEAWADGPPSLDRARQVYIDKYLNPYHVGEIRDQSVARLVGDCLVNPGTEAGGRIVQLAVSWLRPGSVAVDGAVGPSTVSHINGLAPDDLLPSIRAERVWWYFEDEQRRPALIEDLRGWFRRACR